MESAGGSGEGGALPGVPRSITAVERPALRRSELLASLAAAARTPRGLVGLLLTGIVVVAAAGGPFVAPHSSTEFVTSPFAAPSSHTLLGGDALGRDVLSRVLTGGWLLLSAATASAVLGVAAGVALGVMAAYFGRLTDGLIMRTVDVFLAFPQVVFVLLLVSVAGTHLWLIVAAVGMSHAPQVARVIRASALDVCERDFVRAVELLRVPAWKVLAGEVLPNLTSVVMVEFGLRLTYSIIVIASLSFLGFGLQPPSPNWGQMINENREGIASNVWGVAAPTILVAALSVGLNTFTDAVARVSLGLSRGVRQLTPMPGASLDTGSPPTSLRESD
jgi:peptide/nickel transport system permease protein